MPGLRRNILFLKLLFSYSCPFLDLLDISSHAKQVWVGHIHLLLVCPVGGCDTCHSKGGLKFLTKQMVPGICCLTNQAICSFFISGGF